MTMRATTAISPTVVAMRLSIEDLPMFFDPVHTAVAERVRAAAVKIDDLERTDASDGEIVAGLASTDVFSLVVPDGGRIDTRAVCLAREALGYVSARADSIVAVQGLGTYPLVLAGSPAQRAQLPAFARGAGIAAFALTEPDAGSDVAAIATRAAPCADGYRLDGDKLFISNLGCRSRPRASRSWRRLRSPRIRSAHSSCAARSCQRTRASATSDLA
jgi:acyl-CoA dehydrogenase